MPENNIMLASLGAVNTSGMVRRNNAKIDTVWAQTAYSNIPEVPIVGMPYRRADLPDSSIRAGQAYGYIYDDATYNQILYLLTSLWKSMCENGGMPWQKGQTYQQGALCIHNGILYMALAYIPSTVDAEPGKSAYWYDLSPYPFTGNTVSTDGKLGLVPKPVKGQQGCYLKSTGAWETYPSPFPTGSIIAYAGKKAPSSDWLYCDGSTIKRSDYKALFAVIGTKYGAGDGTTTFKIPDLRNRVLEGSNTLGAYGFISAGLPSYIHTHSASLDTTGNHGHGSTISNAGGHTHTRGTWNITGKFSADQFSAFSYPEGGNSHSKADGAFYCTNEQWFAGTSGGADKSVLFKFDANRNWSGQTSNDGTHTHTYSFGADNGHTHGITINKNTEVNSNVYGKSNTVQMAACTCNYIIKCS